MAALAEPVSLASSCPLPHAVAESSERHISTEADAAASRVLRTERLKDAPLQVAPYQATPVCGAITHHHATGLQISDATLPEEVRQAARDAGVGRRDSCSPPPLLPARRNGSQPYTRRSRSTRRSSRSARGTTWGEAGRRGSSFAQRCVARARERDVGAAPRAGGLPGGCLPHPPAPVVTCRAHRRLPRACPAAWARRRLSMRPVPSLSPPSCSTQPPPCAAQVPLQPGL